MYKKLGMAALGAVAAYGAKGKSAQGRRADRKIPAKRKQTVVGPWGTKIMQVSHISEHDSYASRSGWGDKRQIGFVRYQNATWMVERDVSWRDGSGGAWKTAYDKSEQQLIAEGTGRVYTKPAPRPKKSVLPAHLRPEFDRFVLSILGREAFIPHNEIDFGRYRWDKTATKSVWTTPTAGELAEWIFVSSSRTPQLLFSRATGGTVQDPGWQVSAALSDLLSGDITNRWYDSAPLRRKWTGQVSSALARLKKQGKVFSMTSYRNNKEGQEWGLKRYE